MFEPVPGQIVITHAGLLTKRKGIMHFVRAIQTIKCPKVVFNIVGPVSLLDFTAEEASHIEQTWKADDRVRLYRKPVSSEVFQWMINRTDLVFAVYDEWTQGSSVLTHASHAGVPCIVPAGSCMADLCSMFNLGWVVDPTEVTDYSQVFEGFLESRDRDNFGFSDHLSFQSYSNVVSAMQRLIS
jgi:glycosyltransferase involved in cell wall biosynthesis